MALRWLSNEEQGTHTFRGGRHTLPPLEGGSCVGRQLAAWVRSKVECRFQNMPQHGGYLTEVKETSGNIGQQVWGKGGKKNFKELSPQKLKYQNTPHSFCWWSQKCPHKTNFRNECFQPISLWCGIKDYLLLIRFPVCKQDGLKPRRNNSNAG